MKKLILAILLLVTFYFSVFPVRLFAQEKTASESSGATATSPAKIEYSLPYPGILPDNPLYFLKAIRDRLVSLLINSPVKKAEFDLLTSDKRIAAAQLLAERGKDQLAFSTLSKSNNYMSLAVSSSAQAKKMGENVDTVLNTLKSSIKKHQEMLIGIKKMLPSQFSQQLQQELKRLSEFEQSVNKLSPGV